ncbi:MAG: SRPBCC domain-containing protein [Tannerellaceae bacterium]|nr:SRPBCC domain-containing protein [Tannerellaceae bacterium]
MREEAIVVEQKINAPRERVWKALTEREEMRHWYFDITRFWPELGCDFQFNEIKGGKKYIHLCRIIDVQEKRKLAYTWKYEGFPGESVVTFELIPEDGQTTVRLTHRGVETFARMGANFSRERFEKEWNRIIKESLTDFAERNMICKSVTINADTPFVWLVITQTDLIRHWIPKKGTLVETDWEENSEVLWRDSQGSVIARGIVTVNHPEHYLKIHFPCYDETSCALNPGEDYQIFILTGISMNQCMLEVECNTFTEYSSQLDSYWSLALKKIKQMSESMAKEALMVIS